jgi:hypothetical protein
MIEQHNNQLWISFPTSEEATTFAKVLELLFRMQNQSATGPGPVGSSEPPSESPLPDFQEPVRSHHVVLTEERQEQLFNQRAQGLSAHQRILRAQTTLRDGVLPFSKPGQTPVPTSQPSPRMKGVFAGEPQRSPDPLQATALPAPVGPDPQPSVPAAPRKTKLQRSPPPSQS